MYPMHPDDILDEEARFFGPKNEFEAAYQVSMATTPQLRVDPRELDRLTRCGWYPLLMRTIRYCRFTDATLPGYDEGLEGIYATRAEAEAQAQRLYDDGLTDCDFHIA